MRQEKPLHKIIKQALQESPTQAFEEEMWADLQAALPEKSKRRFAWWYLSPLLLTGLSVLILSSLHTQKDAKLIEYVRHEQELLRSIRDVEEPTKPKEQSQVEISQEIEKVTLKQKAKTKSRQAENAVVEVSRTEHLPLETKVESSKEQVNREAPVKLKFPPSPFLAVPFKPFEVEKAEVLVKKHPAQKIEFEIKRPFTWGLLTEYHTDFNQKNEQSLRSSSQVQIGVTTIKDLGSNWRGNLNLIYSKKSLSSADNVFETPEPLFYFLADSKGERASLFADIGLVYRLPGAVVSPYAGVGFRQTIVLREQQEFSFIPGIYSEGLDPFEISEQIRTNRWQERLWQIKAGAEWNINQQFSLFTELQYRNFFSKQNASYYSPFNAQIGVLYTHGW